MTRVVAAKALRALVSLWLVTIAIFTLGRLSGDPVRLMLPPDATAADAVALREKLGLDESVVMQYLKFIGGVLHGDLGESIRYGAPAGQLIASRLPNTLALAVVAILIALCVGIPVGVLAASRPGGWWDRVARTVALAGQSIPPFAIGIVLVLVFAVHWQIFPTGDVRGPASYVLPAITLGGFATAAITRISQSSTRDALESPYVVVARSKGLPERVVLFRHALRNAGTAILTISALQLVLFANGAVIVESIFNWPGIGLLTFDAATGRDYPLLQAIVVVTATITIAVNLLVDVAYAVIDRRISHVAHA
jgi:peptide/nickel transport system permease protein